MNLTTAFFLLAVLAVGWYVITTILIYDFLRKRNARVSFILLRLLIFSYVSQYKQITLKETGKVGSLFYHWIVSINVAFLAVIVMVISRI